MAKERINFKISEELVTWIQTNPNIISVSKSDDSCVIEHNMTSGQLTSLKNGIVQRLSETIE